MIAFKACPRCHGDLLAGPDEEMTCLQCGYDVKPAEKQEVVSKMRMHRRRELVAA